MDVRVGEIISPENFEELKQKLDSEELAFMLGNKTAFLFLEEYQ